jgi:integral membrane protein (TIGR01906 family)
MGRGYHGVMRSPLGARLSGIVTGFATAVLIVAVAVVPFMTPAWLSLAQARADAAAWTGYTDAELRTATDALVHDLVLGPPAFDVTVRGAPVLSEAERAHLRDVRGVFSGFAMLAIAALLVVVLALARSGRELATWRAIRNGAGGLVVAVVALGAVAAVAFDAAFELFHRLLFSGNYTFDPRTDRMVQLFPDQLWFETTIAVGVLIVVLALAVVVFARGRTMAIAPRATEQRGVEASPAALREPGS